MELLKLVKPFGSRQWLSSMSKTSFGQPGNARRFTSSPDSKVYEFRRYLIQPNNFGNFLKLAEENMHLRTNVSKCLGYWTCEIGSSLNEVFHIWEYDNLQHRADVRLALSKDESWQKDFVSKSFPLIKQQTNSLMYMPFWFNKMVENKPIQGVYELTTYDMAIGGQVMWGKQLKASIEARMRLGCSDLIGVWYTDLGHQNTVQAIWRYDSYAARTECKARALDDAVLVNKVRDNLKNVISHSRCLMLPASWFLQIASK
uniref:Protein NipSnap homolog 3A n=1 Tax=Phallusia mammillata TaxID=59560 RepID=A0A6F9DMX0_9ASCI|nr:protein NipSnap homolog 3A [Phallusia mammillata]